MVKISDQISFTCIKAEQPIGTFYIGVIDTQDLVEISFADVRRLKARDVEEFSGIQRPLNKKRVDELQKYVETVDASFPTGIILSISSTDARYDNKTKMMLVDRRNDVAKILDGQHRIAGLEKFSGKNFELNVTVFVDMDMEDQAMLFATINLKQTKVSKSLMYDLYDFAKSRSPQKTCHNIAKLLNNEPKSPFKDKIKILGRATGKPHETLTQAAFVDSLIDYLSRDPMTDRDRLRRGKKLRRISDDESQLLIYRNMFIDEQDGEIARNVSNYFSAVSEKWPDAWGKRLRGNILNRTNGLRALMRFHRDCYLSLGYPGDVISTRKYSNIFRAIDLDENHFSADNYKPGSSGEKQLHRDLILESGIEPD